MTQHLYRHFDDSGGLLYIGVSLNVFYRLKQHGKFSGWSNDITKVMVEHFETREAALLAEREAIQAEQPKYNIQHKKPPPEPEPETPAEASRNNLTQRTVARFGVVYDAEDIARIFGYESKHIGEQLIENEKIGFIEIPNPRSPTKKKKKYVTGWQLIDYFENKTK